MADAQPPRQSDGSVGPLLQYWRKARQLSQLALATEAGVSSRHLCFIETGRAKPSREMVLLLSDALDVPLREQNTLLLAAGFAPEFVETPLDGPALEVVRSALDAILEQQEPFPAVVMNRYWDIVRANRAATSFFGFMLEGQPLRETANVLRLMFHPDGLRPFVSNWDAVAEALLRRVHREAVGGIKDQVTAKLLREILAYPSVPAAVAAKWARERERHCRSFRSAFAKLHDNTTSSRLSRRSGRRKTSPRRRFASSASSLRTARRPPALDPSL